MTHLRLPALLILTLQQAVLMY